MHNEAFQKQKTSKITRLKNEFMEAIMKNKTILVALLLIIISTTLLSAGYEDYVIKNKYNETFELSKIVEKPVILLFAIPGCGECEDFKEQTLENESMSQLLKERFLTMEINQLGLKTGKFPVDSEDPKDYSYSILFSKYKIRKTPTVFVFDKKLTIAGRHNGFIGPEQFKEWLTSLDNTFTYNPLPIIKLTSEDEAELILSTIPNSTLIDYKRFQEDYETLDPTDYYVIQNASFNTVQTFTQKNDIILNNIYIYHGTLEKNTSEPPSDTKEGVKIQTDNEWTNLNTEQALEILDKYQDNEGFIILDVRTTNEYDNGHIDGALNLNYYDKFEAEIAKLDKDKIYFVYCQSGGRSSRAVEKMTEAGFEYIYHYEDGYSGFSK